MTLRSSQFNSPRVLHDTSTTSSRGKLDKGKRERGLGMRVVLREPRRRYPRGSLCVVGRRYPKRRVARVSIERRIRWEEIKREKEERKRDRICLDGTAWDAL